MIIPGLSGIKCYAGNSLEVGGVTIMIPGLSVFNTMQRWPGGRSDHDMLSMIRVPVGDES